MAQSFSDAFTRSNAATLGANWTQNNGSTGVLSNQGYAGATGFDECAWNVGCDSSNNYAEVTVSSLGTTGYRSVRVRCRASGSTSYTFGLTYSGGWARDLIRRVSGSDTSLASDFPGSLTLPATIRVEASGSTIRALWNGTVLFSVTDTGIASGTGVGMIVQANDLTAPVPTVDDWAGGDLVDIDLGGAASHYRRRRRPRPVSRTVTARLVATSGGRMQPTRSRFGPVLPALRSRVVLAVEEPAAAGNDVAGTVDVSSAVSGALTADHPVTGTVSTSSAASGTVALQAQTAGTVAAASGVSGALTSDHPIAGTVAAVTATSGALTPTGAAGTVAITSGASGAITSTSGLSGTVAAQSGVSGAISLTAATAGTIPATSATAGTLTPVGAAGTAAAVTTAAGSVTLTVALSGVAAATSTATGAVALNGAVAGSVAVVSTVAGTLTPAGLSGTVTATSTATGAVALNGAVAGSVAATSTFVGTVTARRPTTGTIAATSLTAGAVTARLVVAGVADVISALVDGSIVAPPGGTASGYQPAASTARGASGPPRSGSHQPATSSVTQQAQPARAGGWSPARPRATSG